MIDTVSTGHLAVKQKNYLSRSTPELKKNL